MQLFWYNDGIIFQKGIRMTSTAAKTKAKPPRPAKEAEWSDDFKRWRKEWDEKVRVREEEWAKTWEKVVNASKKLGCYEEHESALAEEEFADALEKSGTIGNIHLTEVRRRMQHHYKYPLVGVNGRAMVVGDFKNHMGAADVDEFADKRLPHFAKDFPAYKNRNIYGMVCAQHFTSTARRKAKERHLFVLSLKNGKPVVDNASNARPISP